MTDIPKPPKIPPVPGPTPPGVPKPPAVPPVPGIPKPPPIPAVPKPPSIPGVPKPPSIPGVPKPPSIPGVPKPPSIPGVPKPPSIPGVPGLSSIPLPDVDIPVPGLGGAPTPPAPPKPPAAPKPPAPPAGAPASPAAASASAPAPAAAPAPAPAATSSSAPASAPASGGGAEGTPGSLDIHFTFEVKGLDAATFVPIRVEGDETLSRLYHFTLDLASEDPEVDPNKVVGQPAVLAIERGDDVTLFHGIVTLFEHAGRGPEVFNYRVLLVPRLHTLSHTKTCQIFLAKTMDVIIKEVLEENGLAKGKDFDIKVKEIGPEREYVVQYQESDLDFICRWMEHEGWYFFFEHGEDQEKLIITDMKETHKPIAGPAEVPFRDARPVNVGGEAVGQLAIRQQQLSKSILLRDYNYRKPTLEIKGEADVLDTGFGTFMEYGNHFKDPADGKRLAKARAEEQMCRHKTYAGQSAVRHFRAGATFTLIDHYVSGCNQKYLITSVHHSGRQVGGVGAVSGSGADRPSYLNTFEAISADVMFRPPRITPKPKIHGYMKATIDAGSSGQYAEIDDLGRYKVKLPFDLSDASGGTASRFIRMAQPYSGPGMGMHFPLHKGTEVLLIHLDGDPDRPVIAASVPNPDTMSPVTGGNQTQCVIHTGGGNKIVIEDTAGGERVAISSPHSETFFSLGAPPE